MAIRVRAPVVDLERRFHKLPGALAGERRDEENRKVPQRGKPADDIPFVYDRRLLVLINQIPTCSSPAARLLPSSAASLRILTS